MMKSNKKLLIWLMIVALIGLNLWRWWPTSSNVPERLAQKSGVLSVEEFEVKATPADTLAPMLRDIFQVKKIVKKQPLVKAKQAVVQLPPAKSQEELARESAEAEFSKIRCVAISVRNERIHAYVINAGEASLVSKGDKVGSRFVVEKIVPDGVTLRDPETGVGGLIAISGK